MDLNALLDLDVVAIEGEETVSVLVELSAPEADAGTERRPIWWTLFSLIAAPSSSVTRAATSAALGSPGAKT